MLWLQRIVVGSAWKMMVTLSGKISTWSRCPTWHDTGRVRRDDELGERGQVI